MCFSIKENNSSHVIDNLINNTSTNANLAQPYMVGVFNVINTDIIL